MTFGNTLFAAATFLALGACAEPTEAPPVESNPTVVDRALYACETVHNRAGDETLTEAIEARYQSRYSFACQLLADYSEVARDEGLPSDVLALANEKAESQASFIVATWEADARELVETEVIE